MILNQASDGYLPIALVLRRALIEYGSLPRQRLLDLCAPPTLAAKGQNDVHHTLLRWTQLGVFTQLNDDAKTIALAPGFATTELAMDDPRQLRRSLRQCVLSEENNRNVLDFEFKSDDAGLCADFTRALTFALAQDPVEDIGVHARFRSLEQRQFLSEAAGETAFRAIQNPDRWPGFKVWSTYLGFVWANPDDALVFDPRQAVADELPVVFGDLDEIRIGSFLDALAEYLPVVDGGRYRSQMDDELRKTGRWRTPLAHEISGSLSRALLRLEIGGAITLKRLADSPGQRTLTGRRGQALREVTHVRRELP